MINSQRVGGSLLAPSSISKGMGDQFSAAQGDDVAVVQYIKGDG